jgi:hypothetical protein
MEKDVEKGKDEVAPGIEVRRRRNILQAMVRKKIQRGVQGKEIHPVPSRAHLEKPGKKI